MDKFTRIFSNNLKSKRREKSMTQEQFAKELNTSKQVISRYENGISLPNIQTTYEMAQILDVDIDFFFYDDGNFKNVCKDRFINVLNKMRKKSNWFNQSKLIENGEGHQLITDYLTNGSGISYIDIFIPFEDNPELMEEVFEAGIKKIKQYDLGPENKTAITEIFKEEIMKGLESSIVNSREDYFRKIQADLIELFVTTISRAFKPTDKDNLFPIELRDVVSEEEYKELRKFFKDISNEFNNKFIKG